MSTTPPTRIRLRQIALVAADLDTIEAEIIGELGVSLCFRDPGVATFGLRNALFPIGDRLLEVVSPTEPDTTAGRLLDRRGGDGGYMAIFETDEALDDIRHRLDDLAVRIVFEAPGDGVTGLHLHPRDVGGPIVSIDRTDTWGEWPWAGPVWRDHIRTEVVSQMVGVEVAANDPGEMSRRWAAVLGRSVDGTTIGLDDGTFVRFVRCGDRGEGIDAVILHRRDGARGAVAIAGCTFRFDVDA